MSECGFSPRIGWLWAIVLLLGLALTGCGLGDEVGRPSPSPLSAVLPTDTTPPLPDLAIQSVALVNVQPRDGACPAPEELIRLEVSIANLGDADASTFVVQADDARQVVSEGLAAGQALTLGFAILNPSPSIRVDVNSQVVESDERNNLFTGRLATPAPPPECLATPTPVVAYQNADLILEGHTASVLAVAFSPDGNLVASGSVDNSMRLWRVEQGQLLRTTQGHPFPILSMQFTPNGATLITGSMDGQIRLWQVSNGSLVRNVTAHAGWVKDVDISADGKIIVSGSDDFTVRLWRLPNLNAVETIDEGMTAVNSVALSPDGASLAFAEANGSVRLWKLNGGRLFTLKSVPIEATSVAFSPDGRLLASGYADGTLRIWQIGDGSLAQLLKGHPQAVTDLAFSPGGEWLVSASSDRTLRLWTFAEQTLQSIPAVIYSGHTGAVRCVDFSPLGDRIASGSDDGSVRVWSLPQPAAP